MSDLLWTVQGIIFFTPPALFMRLLLVCLGYGVTPVLRVSMIPYSMTLVLRLPGMVVAGLLAAATMIGRANCICRFVARALAMVHCWRGGPGRIYRAYCCSGRSYGIGSSALASSFRQDVLNNPAAGEAAHAVTPKCQPCYRLHSK